MATQAIRLGHAPDSSTTVPRGVSASVPAQASTSAIKALAWSVPVRVIIPAISVNAPLTQVGLTKDRAVQMPPLNDHNLAGWYKIQRHAGADGLFADRRSR